MRKTKKRYLCTFCEARLEEGCSFCAACGHPTSWATHEEKVRWELQQYERSRSRTIDLAAVETEPIVVAKQHPLARPTTPRIVHPARRRESPVEAARDATVVATPVQPAPSVPRTEPIAELPDPDDPTMLLKIVRVLNARVADMESRLAALELVKRRVAGS